MGSEKTSKIEPPHSLALADCFAKVTAIRDNTFLVTGDPEFKKVQNMVEIEWL
jgi:hypothetical protein